MNGSFKKAFARLTPAPIELAPQVDALHEKLKRVRYIPQLDVARTYASAGERIARLVEEKSALAIINTSRVPKNSNAAASG